MSDDTRHVNPRTKPVKLAEQAQPPGWVADHFSPEQNAKLVPRTKWFRMLDLVDLSHLEWRVLVRVWDFSDRREPIKTYSAKVSVGTLATLVGSTRTRVREALQRGVDMGVMARSGEGRDVRTYSLAWPPTQPAARRGRVDRLASFGGFCLAEKRGSTGLCHRRAGAGTDHLGTGPCWQHMGPSRTLDGSVGDPPDGSLGNPRWVPHEDPMDLGDQVTDKQGGASPRFGVIRGEGKAS